MNNTYTPSRLDITDAILVLKAASTDDNASKIVREIVSSRYNPQVIELIRDLYKDSEVFCDGMREFIKEPDPIADEMEANYGKGFIRRND